MHKTTGEVWTDSQKLGMWVATACPWSSRQVSLNAYTRMKSTHVASMREELGYWILVPWDSTIEYRCLLCAPSSCVATPPASDSKSGWREVHLVIDGGVCVCVCVCALAVWSSEHEASRVLDGSHFTAFIPFYNWTTTIIATTSLPALNKAWVRALFDWVRPIRLSPRPYLAQ